MAERRGRPPNNQPTAQFYRVVTDNAFPYRIYGAQQDNSTVRIRSRSDGASISERDWEPTAGAESGHVAPDPKDPDVVYGGNYGGFLMRINHRTRERRVIDVWPDNPIGHAAAKLKYRFQWNFPIFFSPHDPKTLYTAGNVLFKTTNEGQSWQAISPDLTRNDKSKQGPSGGPITKDNTSVEYYCTIFAALESPHEAGVLWCGSDDGLIQLSRDGGKKWVNVTPPDLPAWSQINSMEPHPTEKGGLYVAATCYKLDDFAPYLYRTTDYGKTWTKIVAGIPADHFTRVIRADPKRKGLLYAGTEKGMLVSFDDGENWRSFQLNLPIVPITDLAIKDNDLIVATQGRSFWVLDDLTPLHQMRPEVVKELLHLFGPRAAYRLPGSGGRGPASRTQGQNAPSGVVLHYYLRELPPKGTHLQLELLEADGKLIRRFETKGEPTEARQPGGRGRRGGGAPAARLEAKQGMNEFTWDMRYPESESFPGMVMWGGLVAPLAVPGKYQARLRLGDQSQSVTFAITPDPRSAATPEDYQHQFRFLIAARDKLTAAHRAIKEIRDVRDQLTALDKRLGKRKEEADEVVSASQALAKKLTAIEEALHQTKARSPQDVLNYPIRLNNRLASLAGTVSAGDYRPTDQAEQVGQELTKEIDAELAKLRKVLDDDLASFNQLLARKKVPGVFREPVKGKS